MWSLLALLLTLLGAPPARACSCADERGERTVLPADGAVDVPVDTVLRVVFSGTWPYEDGERLAREVRLRGPDGVLVPLARPTAHRQVLTLAPLEPLAPGAVYTVERLLPWSEGRRRSEVLRHAVAEGRSEADGVRLRWTVAGRFETRADALDPRPLAPELREARYSLRSGGGDCGPGENVHGVVVLARDLGPTELVEVEAEGQGSTWFGRGPARLPGEQGAREVVFWTGDTMCTPLPVHTEVSGSPRLRARVRSSGDVPGPWSDWTPLLPSGRSSTAGAGSIHFGGTAHFRLGRPLQPDSWWGEWSQRWFDLPVEDGVVEEVGPPGCRAGPRWAAAPELDLRGAEDWLGIDGRERGALTTGGSAVRVVAGPEGERQRWLHVRAADGAVRERSLPRSVARPTLRTWAGGALLSWSHHDDFDENEVVALDHSGRWQWRRRLLAPHNLHGLHVVASGEAVLVGWQAFELGTRPEPSRTWSAWRVLDPRGRLLAREDGAGLGDVRLEQVLPREEGGWWLRVRVDRAHPGEAEGALAGLSPGAWLLELDAQGVVLGGQPLVLPRRGVLQPLEGGEILLLQPDGADTRVSAWSPTEGEGAELLRLPYALPAPSWASEAGPTVQAVIPGGPLHWVVVTGLGGDIGETVLACAPDGTCSPPAPLLPGHPARAVVAAPAGEGLRVLAHVRGQGGWTPLDGTLRCD